MAQITQLTNQAAQVAPVKLPIGVLQDEPRLAEPGDDAARQHVRAPGQRMPGALQRDPFVDQRARIGARDAGLRRAQMAQPAEAQQRRGPVVGRRLHFENRAPIANHDLAGEGETSGIDFAGARGVGGAQILRRDHQPVGLARDERPAQQRMTVGAAGDAAHRAAQDEPRQLRMVRDGNARHRPARPFARGTAASRARP